MFFCAAPRKAPGLDHGNLQELCGACPCWSSSLGRQDATLGQGQPKEPDPRGLCLGEEEEAGRGGSSSASGLASRPACGWSWAPAHGGTKPGLSSALLPWAAQAGAGFPTPRLPSSLSLFSFFLPHSHPVSPPPPPPYPRFVPAGVSRGQPGSRPFRTPDPHASLLSSNKKVPSAAPTQSRRPKPSKNRAKTISFSVPRAPAAARAERRGLRSARSG